MVESVNSILVFGATGLIGRAVVDRVRGSGIRVSAFSRSPFEAPDVITIRGDIACADEVDRAVELSAPDVIVHLAARLQADCEENPAAAVETNICGTLHVLEAARRRAVRRVVFGSSVAAYGPRAGLMREDDPVVPGASFYGETKRVGEALGAKFAELYGLEFVALRYSGVFGPGPVRGKGMAKARHEIKATAAGRDVEIDYASGAEVCHLTFLADAVEATLAAILHPEPHFRLYNVAGPEANVLSLNDFHAAVRQVAPTAGAVSFSGRGHSGGQLDLSRLRDDLNVWPQISVLEGLQRELAG